MAKGAKSRPVGMVPRRRRKDISVCLLSISQDARAALGGIAMSSNLARDTFLSLKELVNDASNKAGINTVKYEASVLVCRTCLVPLEFVVTDTEIYQCPKCHKLRNRQQRKWLPYRSFVDFRTVGLNE